MGNSLESCGGTNRKDDTEDVPKLQQPPQEKEDPKSKSKPTTTQVKTSDTPKPSPPKEVKTNVVQQPVNKEKETKVVVKEEKEAKKDRADTHLTILDDETDVDDLLSMDPKDFTDDKDGEILDDRSSTGESTLPEPPLIQSTKNKQIAQQQRPSDMPILAPNLGQPTQENYLPPPLENKSEDLPPSLAINPIRSEPKSPKGLSLVLEEELTPPPLSPNDEQVPPLSPRDEPVPPLSPKDEPVPPLSPKGSASAMEDDTLPPLSPRGQTSATLQDDSDLPPLAAKTTVGGVEDAPPALKQRTSEEAEPLSAMSEGPPPLTVKGTSEGTAAAPPTADKDGKSSKKKKNKKKKKKSK